MTGTIKMLLITLFTLVNYYSNQKGTERDATTYSESGKHNKPLIINEILFNPLPGGVEFIEIVNISSNQVNLNEFIIASKRENNISAQYIIAPQGHILQSGEYALLTTSPWIVKNQYYTKNPGSFIQLSKMPQMRNDNGRVVITDLELNIIDDVTYSEQMHTHWIANKKGVSLERVCFEKPSALISNWQSASEQKGFATPGYENSQALHSGFSTRKEIKVSPEIFSPRSDLFNSSGGFVNSTTISYKLDKPGYIGNLTIFDRNGRTIRQLARNELLGTEGEYKWDGRTEEGSYAGLGIYLILLDIYHQNRSSTKLKTTVVIGGNLR